MILKLKKDISIKNVCLPQKFELSLSTNKPRQFENLVSYHSMYTMLTESHPTLELNKATLQSFLFGNEIKFHCMKIATNCIGNNYIVISYVNMQLC